MIFSALFVWNALSLLLGLPPGIIFVFFRSSGAPPLSLWSPVPFGTSHVRLFLLSLATARRVGELQAVSAAVSSSSGSDLFLSYLPSSAPTRNPPLILYLVHSVSGLCAVLLAPYRVSCPYALCVRSRFTCVVLPPFLLVSGRCLFVGGTLPLGTLPMWEYCHWVH